MSALKLRCFSNVARLRQIEPFRLLAFLTPHGEYLASRELTLPPPERPDLLDYEQLAKVLLVAGPDAPADFFEALYFVDEMSGEREMAKLLEAAITRGIAFSDRDDLTPADVAIELWLRDRTIVERLHSERAMDRPRAFEYFPTRDEEPPQPLTLDNVRRVALEEELDTYFVRMKRGRGARVFEHPRDHETWFHVRHGLPFRREESGAGDDVSSVCFRPVKYDLVIYNGERGDLRINAVNKSEKDLYRTAFGRHVFEDVDCFPKSDRYTLEPLRDEGEASLTCGDVDGIEKIVLTEIAYLWENTFEHVESHRASDLFKSSLFVPFQIPHHPKLLQAVFAVHFVGSKTPRKVRVKPPHVVDYVRDGDAGLIERWLELRGFSNGGRRGRTADRSMVECA